jgi:large repetitive protein
MSCLPSNRSICQLFLGTFLIPALGVRAQSIPVPTFPATPVATSSAPVTVTVTAPTGGVVSSVAVLTTGTAGLDFAAGSSSSCQGASLSANQTCTQSVVFTPVYPGIRLGAVVLLDSSNGVIGTAYISGTGRGGLGVLATGNVIPAAGSGAWDLLLDGQLAVNADLQLPSGVALDGAGNMFIADSAHNRIRKVDASTGIISTFAGNGNAAYGGDSGPASTATLNSPSGVAVDGAGNLYIADTGNNVVREVTASTGIITTVAGNPAGTLLGDNGPATLATLNNPWGVTLDAAGNLFIADTANHRIRRVDAITGTITTVAGNGFTVPNGSGGYTGDNGLATLAELNHPYAVAFDAAGNMYIPDASNNCIRVVDTTGKITTFAGDGTVGYKGDGGPATSAKLWYPAGVIVDAAQNVFIADSQNNVIRKVSAATHKIATVAPSVKSLKNNATAYYTVTLYGPMGLALDGNGNLYIADYYNMRIREVQSNVSVLDFTAHSTRQGDVSAPLSQALENDGTDVLMVSSITPVVHAQLDAAGTTCMAGNSLPVNGTCLVSAKFAPTAAGTLIGDIDVAGQSVDSPFQIKLLGVATAVNSTDTVLTTSPNPSNFGQNLTLRAAVTTGANTGALTGSVTFVDTTTGVTLQKDLPVNSSGVASFALSSLGVGLHAITAAYGGDNLHFASTSDPPLNQVVNEQTATALASSANPAAVGAGITLTATVAVSGGGGVTPSGTVTFNDGATVLGTVAISPGGTATLSISTLADGLHALTVTYSGNPSSYVSGSTSAVLQQDVQAASNVVLTSSPNPSSYGTAVTFSAVVTSGSTVAPTGTVKFLDGSTQIGTSTITGTTGVATFTTSSLASGSHTITAAYQGSPNHGPGTSAPLVQTVNKTVTTTTLAATPNPGIAGKNVVLTAAVKNSAGAATTNGSVTFVDGATTLGSATLGTGGTATISAKLAPGSHAVVASYAGDTNDDSSSSAALPVPVNLATTTIALSSSALPATVLAPITFTAVVSGNGGIPGGALSFFVDGVSANTATLDATGKASFTDSALAVGSHAISAGYAGDTNDSSSTSTTLTQAVQAISTVTSLGTGTTSGQDPETILVATVMGGSGPVPTGTITFMNGSTTIGSATLDGNGVATLLPDLAPATYNMVANYSGDALHSSSSSSAIKVSGTPVGFGITVNPTTVSLSSSQNTTVNITIKSSNDYADTIGLGCGTLPSGVTCHFSDDKVTLKAGASADIQLTIDTNSPLGGGSTVMNAHPSGFSLASLFLPAGLFFGWVSWRFRKRNALVFGAFLALFLSGAMLVTGCGSFTEHSAVPGTYTIQITGVGSNSNITHFQAITLTITK